MVNLDHAANNCTITDAAEGSMCSFIQSRSFLTNHDWQRSTLLLYRHYSFRCARDQNSGKNPHESTWVITMSRGQNIELDGLEVQVNFASSMAYTCTFVWLGNIYNNVYNYSPGDCKWFQTVPFVRAWTMWKEYITWRLCEEKVMYDCHSLRAVIGDRELRLSSQLKLVW